MGLALLTNKIEICTFVLWSRVGAVKAWRETYEGRYQTSVRS
jgi:hypothetical protein